MLGLATVQYFQRLMPLLLGWLHSPDAATQLASLHALHTVVCHTWPRIPPHASLIRQHLAALHSDTEAPPEDDQSECSTPRHLKVGSSATPGAESLAVQQNVQAMVKLLDWSCQE